PQTAQQRQAGQDARDRQPDQREAVPDSRDDAAAGPATSGSTAGPAPVAPHGPPLPTTATSHSCPVR
ncbi:MAG: hypothetical protein WBV64_17000, partial [Mycobacterium sp.]